MSSRLSDRWEEETMNTQPAAFDPRKALHDALLAEKMELLAKLPTARGRRCLVIREEIAACDSLLARIARAA
jgi:hypothetical protein